MDDESSKLSRALIVEEGRSAVLGFAIRLDPATNRQAILVKVDLPLPVVTLNCKSSRPRSVILVRRRKICYMGNKILTYC